jgi:hypothetical protein
MLLRDAGSLRSQAGSHQHHSSAVAEPALCLAECPFELVVQRGLIGAGRGVTLT